VVASVTLASVEPAFVYHSGVYRGAAVRRGVTIGVGAAAAGAVARGAYGAQGGYISTLLLEPWYGAVT